jgi:type IV fimbrial biogenesis protein FimT
VGRVHDVTRNSTAGYSLAEIMLVLAVVGVISTMALPSFVNYLRGASTRAGAEELAGIMNLARSVAIKENTQVCVVRGGTNQVRLLMAAANPCAAATFYGAQGRGTDARVGLNGWIALQNGVAITNATANVIFTPLGAAVPAGTFTISKDGQTLSVIVAGSGRVTIGP